MKLDKRRRPDAWRLSGNLPSPTPPCRPTRVAQILFGQRLGHVGEALRDLRLRRSGRLRGARLMQACEGHGDDGDDHAGLDLRDGHGAAAVRHVCLQTPSALGLHPLVDLVLVRAEEREVGRRRRRRAGHPLRREFGMQRLHVVQCRGH
jgi:hypothetical protein